MPTAAAMDDFETHLAAQWTDTPIKRVQGELDALYPADGSAFLAVEYNDGSEEMWSIGNPGGNAFNEMGDIRLVLMVPKGDDVDAARSDFDDLLAAFRPPATFGTDYLMRTEIRRHSAVVDMATYFGVAGIVRFQRWFPG